MALLCNATEPILPTPDLGASRRFYERSLGFRVLFHEKEAYLIVTRESAQIHLWHSADAHTLRPRLCVLIVDEFDALRAEFIGRGLAVVPVPCAAQAFEVIDPHGHRIRFTQGRRAP